MRRRPGRKHISHNAANWWRDQPRHWEEKGAGTQRSRPRGRRQEVCVRVPKVRWNVLMNSFVWPKILRTVKQFNKKQEWCRLYTSSTAHTFHFNSGMSKPCAACTGGGYAFLNLTLWLPAVTLCTDCSVWRYAGPSWGKSSYSQFRFTMAGTTEQDTARLFSAHWSGAAHSIYSSTHDSTMTRGREHNSATKRMRVRPRKEVENVSSFQGLTGWGWGEGLKRGITAPFHLIRQTATVIWLWSPMDHTNPHLLPPLEVFS